MGRKAKAKKPKDELNSILYKILVPEDILLNFEIVDATNYSERWVIELQEFEDRIPRELKEVNDVVLDGFCNPIEVISHSFSAKPVWLRIYRRRWKRSNTDTHYSNEYDFRLKGLKLVPELGIFLKE